MKRKATDPNDSSAVKRQKDSVLDFRDAQPRKEENDVLLWPAAPKAIQDAQNLLKECATSQRKVLLVPDKDADGLDAGVIIHRTLTALGADASSIHVHLVAKGNSIHDEQERAVMKAKDPKYIIVVDQGSRPAPPLVDIPDVKCLIIDHHWSDEFPKDAMVREARLKYSTH
ncbi:MAG: hypothetical protein Q9196_003166 [Gyalolechia fulgens]